MVLCWWHFFTWYFPIDLSFTYTQKSQISKCVIYRISGFALFYCGFQIIWSNDKILNFSFWYLLQQKKARVWGLPYYWNYCKACLKNLMVLYPEQINYLLDRTVISFLFQKLFSCVLDTFLSKGETKAIHQKEQVIFISNINICSNTLEHELLPLDENKFHKSN